MGCAKSREEAYSPALARHTQPNNAQCPKKGGCGESNNSINLSADKLSNETGSRCRSPFDDPINMKNSSSCSMGLIVPETVGMRQQYKVEDFLGKGTWAVVHRCTDTSSPGKQYAVKSYNKLKLTGNNFEMTAKREVKLLQRLKPHENVCSLIDTSEDNKWFHVIVNLGEPMDLQQVIDRNPLTEKEAKKAFKDLMQAVKHIHRNSVCHRDIKPTNLIYAKGTDTLMLTDFGLGEVMQKGKKLAEMCGTPDFIAPEVTAMQGYHGDKADIWSCAVTLYFMLVGKSPWLGASKNYKQKQIAAGDYRAACLNKNSSELQSLMKKMFEVEARHRPVASQVLGHPWLSEGKMYF